MSKKKVNPLVGEPKRKRHLYGLWIPLGIVAGLILIPAGLAMALFFDTTHHDTGVKEAVEAEQLFGDVKNNLLTNCRATENQSIDIAISVESLNKLLYGVCENLNTNVGNATANMVKIDQIDLRIEQNIYNFEIEASAAGFFETYAVVTMEISKQELEEYGNSFVFDILDAKVGRLGGLFDLASSFVPFDQLLKLPGINWTYEKENSRLVYPYSTFQDDLLSLANFGEGMFTDLFSTFFEKNLIEFGHTDEQIKGSVSLELFKKNSIYYSESLTIKEEDPTTHELMLNVFADKVQGLLNDDVLTESMAKAINENYTLEEAAQSVHQFLCFGKDYISSSYGESLINALMEKDAFKTLVGNKTVDEYSTYRKNAYFGAVDTDFVEEIKENAQSKAQALLDGSKDTIAEYTKEEIIDMIIHGQVPPEFNEEDLKMTALFKGIQGKIQGKEKAWYLYGGDHTTYYFDNTGKDWKQIYAKAYDSVHGNYESESGIRMFHIGDETSNIWSFDVSSEYDQIEFFDGATSETTGFLNLDSTKRLYDGTEWKVYQGEEIANEIPIYDSGIHNLVKANSGIIGYGFPFLSKNGEDYVFSYTMVDNIYPVTTKVGEKNYFALVFGLNINGTETQLILPCEQDTSYVPTEENVFGLRYDLEHSTMYYGDLEVPKVKETLTNLIKDSAFSSSFFAIEDGATGMKFNIDLSSLVNSGNFKTLHDHLTSSHTDPSDPEYDKFACNAELFLNIIPIVNAAEDQDDLGVGGFDIEVGYRAKTA